MFRVTQKALQACGIPGLRSEMHFFLWTLLQAQSCSCHPARRDSHASREVRSSVYGGAVHGACRELLAGVRRKCVARRIGNSDVLCEGKASAVVRIPSCGSVALIIYGSTYSFLRCRWCERHMNAVCLCLTLPSRASSTKDTPANDLFLTIWILQSKAPLMKASVCWPQQRQSWWGTMACGPCSTNTYTSHTVYYTYIYTVCIYCKLTSEACWPGLALLTHAVSPFHA